MKNICYSRFLVGTVVLLAAAFVAAVAGHYDLASGTALAAVVQSAYNTGIQPAVAGMWADMSNWDADSLNCETTDGIGFGLAVGQGSADRGGVLGGSLANFRGVSVRDVTQVSDDGDAYALNKEMAVGYRGAIWVQTSVATSPTDPVHYDATTGIFQISGGSGPIVGGRWLQSSDAGLGLLRLSGHVPVP